MAWSDLIEAVDRAGQTHLGGEPVVYQPSAAEPVTVTGIFDKNATVLTDGEANVEQVSPVVFLRLADLPTDPDLDDPLLTIHGVTYRVERRVPDSEGGIQLFLQPV